MMKKYHFTDYKFMTGTVTLKEDRGLLYSILSQKTKQTYDQ